MREVCRLIVCLSLAFFVLADAPADIFRWDNGELIPGTEGIALGPGVDLSRWNVQSGRALLYADECNRSPAGLRV